MTTKTNLHYLEDTYLSEDTATYLRIEESDHGKAVILDKTIFYPQGGGQPSDTGYISTDTARFRVDFVSLDEKGVVHHFGEFEKGIFDAGAKVTMKINAEERKKHARIHSAGHLIDCAVQNINTDLVPEKGFHFPTGPYVEYEGVIEDKESFKEQLQKEVNILISQNIPLHKKVVTQKEIEEQKIQAPKNKELVRIVAFGRYNPCGCGGTHVNSSSDIIHINIRKISSKKGLVRVSYLIDDI